MTVLAAAWKFFTSPVGIAALAALAFGIFTYNVYQEGKESGSSAVILEQAKKDKEVINKTRDMRDNVDRCRAVGGMWNREQGKCL